MHSGKPSPSAILGEEPPANPFTRKSPSPTVKNRALGEGFAECRAGTRGRLDAVGRRPTPFSFFSFLIFFPECNTRERFLIFFKYSLPSAVAQALGEEICFFLNPTFPSATAQALGEATSKILFFVFCFSI